MPKGEVRQLKYTPGEAPPESLPPEAGDYALKLIDVGERGRKGWTPNRDAKKYPYRRLEWEVQGTEDEITGEPKTFRAVFSLSPGYVLTVLRLAHAADYQEEMNPPAFKSPRDPNLKDWADMVDSLLEYILDNEVLINATLNEEDYRGRPQVNLARFLPPGEISADEEATERPAPAKKGKKNGVEKKAAFSDEGEAEEAEPQSEEELQPDDDTMPSGFESDEPVEEEEPQPKKVARRR